MYSNHSFINVICSLKEKFKGFNDPSLKEDSLNKIPEIDRPFISKLNKIKKNRFDSVIKDLLDNLDFFDFIYSKKMEFEGCDEDTSKILYSKLQEEYETKKQENKKEFNQQQPFKNFLFNLYEESK